MPVAECVANISEGRDRRAVAAVAAAAVAAGAAVLDVHSDPDHHRSVLTLAALPDRLADVAVALAAACLELPDVSRHVGVHPRFGLLDVCPFVPLDFPDDPLGTDDLAGAVADAAARIAALGLPVFRYDAASAVGRSLPEVRRGAFVDVAPDAGPSAPHPHGGAVALGVRTPLVAYNVDVATDDMAVARRVAQRVRHVNGGPAGLRALALALGSQRRTQISMNCTQPGTAGVGAAWDAVAAAAAAEGTAIADGDAGELVGLVPAAAIADADAEVLQRSGITADRTVEAALVRAGLRPSTEPSLRCP
jgi:glutamate formiminotransferase